MDWLASNLVSRGVRVTPNVFRAMMWLGGSIVSLVVGMLIVLGHGWDLVAFAIMGIYLLGCVLMIQVWHLQDPARNKIPPP